MRQIAFILLALGSLVFLVGANCDSGDFTTSYFFCCASDGVSDCTSDPTACVPNGCTTGQMTFSNGANECNTLEDDAQNNNCALFQRADLFMAIQCVGGFQENPLPASPSPNPSSF